ncbi:MAG TPA: alkaline phosphatase D family protein [Cryomorphaceae bacterium]|nr:alkaline phosphatase D family protein [Cryomorphaceae bacterium]
MKSNVFYFLVLAVLVFSCTSNHPKEDNLEPRIVHVWSGAVDTSSAEIGIATFISTKVHIAFSTDSTVGENLRYSDSFYTDSLSGYGSIGLDSLQPNTTYYYRGLIGDTISGPIGKFKTHGPGIASFEFVFASCMRTGSESQIFGAMADLDPLFYLNTGDFHYENIERNCKENFRDAFRANWMSKSQAKLFRTAPFIYMWDDHDYGPNNSSRKAPCRESAVQAYRQFVPHYPLAFDSKKGPVSQSFPMGRVRFILADLRSQKVKPKYRDCERISPGSNFGTDEHFNWFLNELLLAKQRGELVVWVSGIPFINQPGGPNYDCDEDDDWGGYPEERKRIANFISLHEIPICILSGDAHMCAIDDGSNSSYADVGSEGIPVFHAGPMHEETSYKGGPYSHGYSASPYQFGVMRVNDDGGDGICIEWEARDINGALVRVASQNGIQPLAYRFCRDLTPVENESFNSKNNSLDN